MQLKIERRRISTPSGHLPNFLDDLKSRRVDFSQRVQFFQLEGPNCTSNQSKDVLFYSYVLTTSHYSHYTLQLHCTRASGESENLVGTTSSKLQTHFLYLNEGIHWFWGGCIGKYCHHPDELPVNKYLWLYMKIFL